MAACAPARSTFFSVLSKSSADATSRARVEGRGMRGVHGRRRGEGWRECVFRASEEETIVFFGELR